MMTSKVARLFLTPKQDVVPEQGTLLGYFRYKGRGANRDLGVNLLYIYHEDEVAREVGLSHEEEHVEPKKRHVLEDGYYDAHGVQADETLDADVVAQVLHAERRERSSTEQTEKMNEHALYRWCRVDCSSATDNGETAVHAAQHRVSRIRNRD